MIDWARFALSIVVVQHHLCVGGVGRHAVMAFYILSGLLCAANQKPGLEFIKGRILRLYPAYLALFILFLYAWLLIEPAPAFGGVGIPMPIDLALQSIMVVPEGMRVKAIPQAFFITNLLACYVLKALGLLSTPPKCLAVSTAAFIIANELFKLRQFNDFYFSPWFALMCFSVGCLAYHQGVRVPRMGREGGLTQLAGAVSYPIYLSHWGIGAIISTMWGVSIGWPLFWLSLPPTLALSWLLVVAVERPIARYRKKFHTKHMEN